MATARASAIKAGRTRIGEKSRIGLIRGAVEVILRNAMSRRGNACRLRLVILSEDKDFNGLRVDPIIQKAANDGGLKLIAPGLWLWKATAP
jgi:hypothetical protein